MARLNPNSLVVDESIEVSSAVNPVAYVEQIKNSAGTTLLQLIGAAGAPAADLEKSVFLSNSGDDGNDGLNPAEPVKTWAKAYQLALGGSETKVIQIPDASVFTITHDASAVTVHGFNGARLIGDFTPRGEWYVTYLGDHTAATKNVITLGEGLKIVCSEIHADLQDANSAYNALTYTVANELDGKLTLRGVGVLNFFIPIVTGVIAINDINRVYGLIREKIYGADFTHLLGHFLGITAHEGTFDTLTVHGDIINTALNSRLDLISRSRLEASADVIPAGEAIAKHRPVTVADTPSGPRYYWAKDRSGDDSLVVKDAYTAQEVTDNARLTTRQLDTNFTGSLSTNVKTHVEFDPGTTWGALVWGDNSTNNVRARIVGKDPATGYTNSLLNNPDGNVFAEYSISTTGKGDVNALAVAWGQRRDKDLWIFASLGTDKDVYACHHQVDASGNIANNGTWFKLPFVHDADSLAVFYDVARDSFHFASYSIVASLFDFRSYTISVTSDSNGFNYNTGGGANGFVDQIVGVPPSSCVSSLGLTMHGDDILLVAPTDNNGEVVLYRIGTDVNGNFAKERSTNTGVYLLSGKDTLEEWGMGSDGVELYFVGSTDHRDTNANPSYTAMASFFVEDLVLKPVTEVYDIMNGVNVTSLAVAVNGVLGSDDPQSEFTPQVVSSIDVVGVDQATQQKVHKTQFHLPTPTTSYKKPVGIAKVDAQPGEVPLVAGNGEKVGGFTNRQIDENYYLFPSGYIDTDDQGFGSGVTIYQALTSTTILVKISADSEKIAQSEEGIRTTQEDIFALENTQANLVAGEPLETFRFVHMDDYRPGELFHAQDTSGKPHDPSKMSLYTGLVGSTGYPDAYQDTDFAEQFGTNGNPVLDCAIAIDNNHAMVSVAYSGNIRTIIIESDAIADQDDAYRRADFDPSSIDNIDDYQLALGTGSSPAGLQCALTGEFSSVTFNRSAGNGSIHAQVADWSGASPQYFTSQSISGYYDSRLLMHDNRLYAIFSANIGTARGFHISNFALDPNTDRFISFSDTYSTTAWIETATFSSFSEHEFGLIPVGDRLAAIYSGDNGRTYGRWIDRDAQGVLSHGNRSANADTISFPDLRFWSVVSFGYSIVFVGIRWAAATRGQVDMHFYHLETTDDDRPIFSKADEPLTNIFNDTGTGEQAIPRAAYNPLNHSVEVVQYMRSAGNVGNVRKTQINMGISNHALRPIVGYTSTPAAVGDKVLLSTRGQIVNLPKGLLDAATGDTISLNQDGTVEIKTGATASDAVDVMEAVDTSYGVLTYPLGSS